MEIAEMGDNRVKIRRVEEQRAVGEIDQREFFENVATYQSRLYATSAAYNQVVVLAGYAGFFAIWASLKPDMARWVIQTSGGLMVVSLILYGGWTVVQMYVGKVHSGHMLAEIAKGREDFHRRIGAAEARGIAASQSLMRWWKPVVWSSGLAALAAGLIVSVSAFLAVAG